MVAPGAGFVPNTSDSYKIIAANSLNGTFNKGSSLVSAGAGFLKVSYNSNSVTLAPTNVITFYDEFPSTNLNSGHAFVRMTAANGVTECYGFYPYYRGSPIGPGFIQNDNSTSWNYDIAYPVSQSLYNAAASLIIQDNGSPPIYNLPHYNCTDFIQSVAAAAGIQLPNIAGVYGISDPLFFGAALQNIGDGNSKFGGTVRFNPSISSQSNARLALSAAVTTPSDYSYSALEQAGNSNPSALASALGFPLNQIDLGTVTSNTVSGLTVNVLGADPSEDLISMNWGDGSSDQGQALSFSHVYAPGSYLADLLEVDDGAVHSYEMSVQVSSGSSTPISINIAPYPANNNINPGLIAAEPVPGVPEPATLSLTCGGAMVLLGCRRRRKIEASI